MSFSGKLLSFRVYCGLAPKSLPRAVPRTYDFTSATSIVQQMNNAVEEDKIEFLQAIYADNSNNPAALIFTFPGTQQSITFPPYSQGYMPVLAIDPPTFTVASTGGVAITAQLLSFAVPACIWSSTSAPGGGGGGSGTPATDGSGTITTGNTAQSLFAGAKPTNGFSVSNPDPSNDLWISDSTTAVANGVGNFRVAANGGYYATEPGEKPVGAVSIVGAVTGQKFTARKW